ncbi:MAG TPA: tetratricopeptide repeat protein [Ideonella sp.]|uniref:nuclear transport factor 2 family protein n=1 Tax=Ideonella sp. TaxID=1929293 RepID=UPI002CDB6B28|nr:tetratricopeptide repeat protein [Ideonella sp.]HSI51601.1 tetratricopeptide repeat protein [Ideonella sp.]
MLFARAPLASQAILHADRAARPVRSLSCGWLLALGALVSLPAAAQTAPAAAAKPAAVSAEATEVQRLIRDGQHTQALKLIDETLARNPKDAQMRFRRGVALSMLDRKQEALTVFQKLVEDHPDMPAPYNNMAVIYGSMGDYDKAREALDKAIRTNPTYATAYQNLGDVYAQLASQAYNKALQLDKNDATSAPKLALLRELTAAPNVAPPPMPSKKPPVIAAAPAVAPSAPAPTPAIAPSAAAAPASTAVAVAKPKPEPAKPEPAKPTPAAAPEGQAEVEAAVRAWAAAWSSRDMSGYFAAYAPDFKGSAASRKAWEQDREARIAPRKKIRVELADLSVQVKGNQATVRFRQAYSSDTLSTTGRKTLELQRSDHGKWQIKQESVGG